jgi:hypothetical protein
MAMLLLMVMATELVVVIVVVPNHDRHQHNNPQTLCNHHQPQLTKRSEYEKYQTSLLMHPLLLQPNLKQLQFDPTLMPAVRLPAPPLLHRMQPHKCRSLAAIAVVCHTLACSLLQKEIVVEICFCAITDKPVRCSEKPIEHKCDGLSRGNNAAARS